MTAGHWEKPFAKLIKIYQGKTHPLEYKNIYQLLVMVVLSAQDSDAKINALAPDLFAAFPNMPALAKATQGDLLPYLSKVRGHLKKISWLLEIAQVVKTDAKIPKNMEALVALKGIGRKSANVIMREAGVQAQGIMVDLHVLRVMDRIGVSHAKIGDLMERELMDIFPAKMWKDLGMATSFLGRDICRPSNPDHESCIMNKVCEYCLNARIG